MSFLGGVEYHGNAGVIMSDPGTLTTDKTSLQTCTAEFTCPVAAYHSLPQVGAAHPIFGHVTMERRVVSIQGPYAVARCSYAGIDTDETAPTYETLVGLAEAPIDTHPDFVTTIGGTAMAPLNGANFAKADGTIANAASPADSNNGFQFRFFDTVVGGAVNPYAGCENYLEASQITFRRIVNYRTTSSIAAAGTIEAPSGPAPVLPAGAIWLNMGYSSTQRGSAFQVAQEWRASGRRGWNTTIYG